MNSAKQNDWNEKATMVSRDAKADLSDVWRKHKDRLRECMYGYEFEELELIYKQLQLKLRNQQSSGY